MYKDLLEEYKSRHMTYFADSLNAFSALIRTLSTGFGTTFRSGLPVSDFPYALGWQQVVPTERVLAYPSWSWAAWEGELVMGASDPYKYDEWQPAEDDRPFFEPYFRVDELIDGSFVPLYERNVDEGHRTPWKETVEDVELLKIKALPFEDAAGLAEPSLQGGKPLGPGLLVVEGITLTLLIDGPANVSGPDSKYPLATFEVFLGETKCELITASRAHADVVRAKGGGKVQEALVLQRGEFINEVLYDVVLLEWEDGVAYRVDYVGLKVPGKELDQIKETSPIRKRFWFG